MGELLRRLRSLMGLLLALATFPPGAVPLYLVVVPLAWLRPAWRPRLISLFMKMQSALILVALRLGGGRFERPGVLPTESPVLVVANHQSLTDILQVTLLARPYVPAFVVRARYRRFVPLVSTSMWLLGCPIVDPVADARGSVRAVAAGARTLPHGLLLFPEGHRSRDGELRPFKTAGLRAALEERRMPVYLVVSDGFWRARRLVDFVFRVHLLRGESRVVGPIEPPADSAELEAFVLSLRERMAAELAAMRRGS